MSFFLNFYTYNNTDSDDLPTSPTSPTTPTTPNSPNTHNHTHSPNYQRRASESISAITDSFQFRKSASTRRNTLPSRMFSSTKLWESGRDSSLQVAMENVQFGA